MKKELMRLQIKESKARTRSFNTETEATLLLIKMRREMIKTDKMCQDIIKDADSDSEKELRMHT